MFQIDDTILDQVFASAIFIFDPSDKMNLHLRFIATCKRKLKTYSSRWHISIHKRFVFKSSDIQDTDDLLTAHDNEREFFLVKLRHQESICLLVIVWIGFVYNLDCVKIFNQVCLTEIASYKEFASSVLQNLLLQIVIIFVIL